MPIPTNTHGARRHIDHWYRWRRFDLHDWMVNQSIAIGSRFNFCLIPDRWLTLYLVSLTLSKVTHGCRHVALGLSTPRPRSDREVRNEK